MVDLLIITIPSNRPLPIANEGMKHILAIKEGIAGTRPDVAHLCMMDSNGNYIWQKWFDGDGKVYIGTMAALPAATVDWLHCIVIIPGPPDNAYICLQNTAGAYFWRQILSGDGDSDRNDITGI